MSIDFSFELVCSMVCMKGMMMGCFDRYYRTMSLPSLQHLTKDQKALVKKVILKVKEKGPKTSEDQRRMITHYLKEEVGEEKAEIIFNQVLFCFFVFLLALFSFCFLFSFSRPLLAEKG